MDGGAVNDNSATHYERMIAVVDMINVLDVWRRGSDQYLTH